MLPSGFAAPRALISGHGTNNSSISASRPCASGLPVPPRLRKPPPARGANEGIGEVLARRVPPDAPRRHDAPLFENLIGQRTEPALLPGRLEQRPARRQRSLGES